MTQTDPMRLPLTSADVTADTLDALRALVPAAFTEGKLDVSRLSQLLGDAAASGPERYGLSWAGKADAVRAVQSLSTGTLVPAPDESVNFDTSENLILEGDNLEILKLLQKSYHGKVKMIYIDPPYNTGHEFIYPDNFREGLADYLKYSGQVDGEGMKMTVNAETGGRYHSNWLSMMYPRLFLARNLLRDDGVIFISIDDHEVHNLRLLMNEVIGEENFIANVVWRRTVSRAVSGKGIAVAHDHILCYGKSEQSTINKVGVGDASGYKNSDDDVRGVYKLQKLERTLEGARPTMTFPIATPLGEVTRTWSVSPEKYARLLEDGRIAFSKSGTPYYKQFLSEFGGVLPDTWWDKEGGNNQDGSRDLKALFGPDEHFSFPKPVNLIKFMLRISTLGAPDETIMDFFAGSGTTAQAVLELNKEDGGNRKFILNQLPEPTNNPQFTTIADITKERVRRVITRLNASTANATPPPPK